MERAVSCDPVLRATPDNGTVKKSDLLQSPDRAAHLRLGQAEIGSAGKLAAVYRERRCDPRRR